MIKSVVLLIISFSLIAGLNFFVFKDKTNLSPAEKLKSKTATLVSAEEFDQLAKDPKAFILDVHIPEQTHIPATDAFIPYNEIDKNLKQLPQDKNTPILVYCRSGSMSREAGEKLMNLGYSKIYDLTGGTNAYKKVHTTVSIIPKTRDLGTVVYGDVAQTSFTITNFTPNPLKITRVSTSCGCTSADVVKKELLPYEETVINVSFDPAVHKNDTDLGDLIRTIYIETDNPNFAKLTVNITARVIKEKADGR